MRVYVLFSLSENTKKLYFITTSWVHIMCTTIIVMRLQSVEEVTELLFSFSSLRHVGSVRAPLETEQMSLSRVGASVR